MRVLVFGRTGQVARELARRAPADRAMVFLDRADADLGIPEACFAAIMSHRPDAVINAAAWTGVDRAEDDEAAATLVNAHAPGAMARAAVELAIPFLHLSTDYVFDGRGDRPFAPDAPTNPLGAYGRSKLAGEQAIRDSGARALVLRTSWVISAHGTNFVKTMLRLGQERQTLNVVADQIGGPTPAAAIADALHAVLPVLAAGHPGGTHHFAGAPDASWADLARAVMAGATLPCRILDIPSAAYPTPARRPLNSRLDCSGFERDFGIARPDWRTGLQDILKELGAC
ncbi:dTDP-4-dehydrorhamnose reductase [Halovulum dunhuangense]|uniref:dTDP-4-dehydrorhamnose reductase n=1 Tax=Halovulum dunhuangense TaxID=1505036 RepID=A0A849L775_9RHOB|nr:dTDP-4-dehydrorhamnose reductase [Halovulum dunhuangense]NNU81994.1 dTDP-4-dehydrorhamnose reductase [Halovulum dunhuangense]